MLVTDIVHDPLVPVLSNAQAALFLNPQVGFKLPDTVDTISISMFDKFDASIIE